MKRSAMAFRIFVYTLGILFIPILNFAQGESGQLGAKKTHHTKHHKHTSASMSDTSAKKKAIRRVLIEKTAGKGLPGGEIIKK